MQIEIGSFMLKPTEPNAHHMRNGAVPELSMKKGEREVYELKDAIAAAKRIERGIERAAKAALEGGAE